MYGGSNYFNRKEGWDTTSYDYHSHVSRMERMPSVLTDVPHYPNIHMIFNTRPKVAAYEEENGNGNQQQQRQQEPPATEAHKKVKFVEQTVAIEKDGAKREVCKKSVDEDVEGFIQQRRKNFELCKWATFKPWELIKILEYYSVMGGQLFSILMK